MEIKKTLNDWIIVDIIDEEVENKVGGLTVTDVEPKRYVKAKVVSIGPGCFYAGAFVSPEHDLGIKVDDTVIFMDMAMRVELTKTRFAIKPSDFIAVV